MSRREDRLTDEDELRALLRAVNDLHALAGETEIHERLRDAALALTGATGATVAAAAVGDGPAAALVDPGGRHHGWIRLTGLRGGGLAGRDRIVLEALADAAAAALGRNADAGPAAGRGPRQPELVALSQRLARVGAWSVDLATGRTSWTGEVAEIHELPPAFCPGIDEALGYYAPEWRDRIAALYRRCAEQGLPYDLELELVTAKGRRVWVRTIGEAERDGSGRIVRVNGAFQDISRLKAAEARIRGVLESITDAFFAVDRDWRITYLNREAERLLRRSRDELLGAGLWAQFPEAEGTAFWEQYHRAMELGEKVTFTADYAPLDTSFRVTAYPSAEGLAVYFQDVTQQRQAVEALRESEARFRILAKATADTVWDWDLVDNRFWWGEGGGAMFAPGPAAPDARIDLWTDRIHPDDRSRVLHDLHAGIAAGRESWSDEYRFQRSDGSYATVSDRGFVIRDENGRPVRMVGGMSDVSQSRELEWRLRQAQRLEAIGQLTGGVAHDFNNLLTVILGNAEALSQGLQRDPRLGRLAEITRQAAERGSELTRRLLAFARRQPLEPRAVDAANLVEEMRPLLQNAAGESVEVALAVAGGKLRDALADPAQLEAAILNLCLNARDAMPDGGRLTIELANVELDRTYAEWNDGASAGPHVLVAVSDTGTGMTPEVLARAFEPFFTTKPPGRGSGLGLSMVYGFARQSGGHLRIYSEPGVGTTVKLYLPQAGAGDLPAEARAKVEALPRGGERILLAEDDDLVRVHVAAQLRQLGYRVVCVGNGPDALEAIGRDPEIDLLFTDMVMPGGLDGRQLAEHALQVRPQLRVLFTSGYTENAIVHNGRLDPGIHFLNKPYRRSELAVKLRQVLDAEAPSQGTGRWPASC